MESMISKYGIVVGLMEDFSIQYVPFGMIQIDENDYWPTKYQGYVNNIHILRTSKGVDIDIYNAEKVSEIQHDRLSYSSIIKSMKRIVF